MAIDERGESQPLTEDQARRSEIELMRGRLWHLTQRANLTTRERIGTCLALEVLDLRAGELRIRTTEEAPA